MGQYHLTVNLDKNEFIHPHGLGDGLKLWEQAASDDGGVGSALIVLLAASNGRGGGDFDDEPAGAKEIIGRWAGDRIAIVGDYAEPGDLPDEYRAESIYARCREGNADGNPKFRDITAKVREVLKRELEIEYTGEPDSWMSRKAKGV